MKSAAFTLLVIIFLGNTLNLYSQTSGLVHIGAQGKLEYTPYANTGQTNAVNIIPDFSFSGYKMGGVTIPVVPVVETISPIVGDARVLIQSAIDRVSLLSLGANGFRGAILIKSGKYEINGPLFIRAGGVVLRGEGQNTPDKGGTELVATSLEQHDFIQFIGDEKSSLVYENILDTKEYPAVHTWLEFNALTGVVDESEGNKIITFHIVSDVNQFTNYASREDTLFRPKLEIVSTSSTTGIDTLITLTPIADATVQAGVSASLNFGTDQSLSVKNAGINNNVTREVYLKFDIPGTLETVKSATLKLYTKKDLIADTAAQKLVHHTLLYQRDDNWEETSITYENSRTSIDTSSTKLITSSYLPSGTSSFTVANTAGLSVGDTINVTRTPNDQWLLDLDNMAQYGWTASSYEISYERRIKALNGNVITVDIPLVQTIENLYGGGNVQKVSVSGRLENCGIENMLITSVYTSDTAENHGWSAVTLSYTANSWIRKITARYFGYGCVSLDYAYNTTVEECAMLDAKSITTGGRKYSFNISKGSFNLFQRCYTRGGRHDFVLGSRVAGPNAFVDCFSEETYADIGPHQRYSTGSLFDNVQGGETRVQNRKDMGTGHGWAGAQTMFWNCVSNTSEFKVESPKGALNWGIGCKGVLKTGAGFWENWGTTTQPRSLYFQQLKDRLGENAVNNVTIPLQRTGDIWTALKSWRGIGDFSFPLGIKHGDEQLHGKYSLGQNYPNPFNPSTVISYTLPQNSFVTIKIFDVLGKEVISLVNEFQHAGEYKKELSLTSTGLSSGIYFYSLHAGEYSSVKKMILLK